VETFVREIIASSTLAYSILIGSIASNMVFTVFMIEIVDGVIDFAYVIDVVIVIIIVVAADAADAAVDCYELHST